MEKKVILKDADGKPHTYEVVPFTMSDGGYDVLNTILYVVFDGGGKIANPLIEALTKSKGLETDISLKNMELILSLDFDKLGKAGIVLLQRLQEAGGLEFFVKLFSKTTRDGAKMDAGTIDIAYCDNYSEFLHAVLFVVNANFAKSIKGFFGG